MRRAIFEGMRQHAVIWMLLASTVGLGHMAAAQSPKNEASQPKPSFDLLAARVEEYWNLLDQQDKAKASEYILPEDREQFFKLTIFQFSDPRLKSLEPSADRSEAKVVVTIKRMLPFGEMDWPMTGMWVFKENNWHVRLSKETMPTEDTPPPPGKIRSEAEKYELQKKLRFDQSMLDFGMVRRGDSVSLKLKYSLDGKEAMFIRTAFSNPEIKLQGLINRRLMPGNSMELTVSMPTGNYEGIVQESIELFARREKIEVPFKFNIQGFVYVPVMFNPKILRFNPKKDAGEKELLIRNNSRSKLEIRSFSCESRALELEPLPLVIPSGQQIALKLKQVRNMEKPDTPDTLSLKFAQPVEDVSSINIHIVLDAKDTRDGLINDPLSDPVIQKQIRQNLKRTPKKRT